MTLDDLNMRSMEMIVAAGEARTALNRALDAIDDQEKYDELMEEARKAITRSHTAQTKVGNGSFLLSEHPLHSCPGHSDDGHERDQHRKADRQGLPQDPGEGQ